MDESSSENRIGAIRVQGRPGSAIVKPLLPQESELTQEQEEPEPTQEEIENTLKALFDGYAKLIASMQSYSIKDFIDQKVKSAFLRELIYLPIGVSYKNESKVLEHDLRNRKFALRRARNFCSNLLPIFEDIERSGNEEFRSSRAIKQLIMDFMKQLPEPQWGITSRQIRSLIAVGSPFVGIAIDLITNEQWLTSLILSIGASGVLLVCIWTGVWLGVLFSEYIWYRIMARKFEIGKAELAVLMKIRPMTKKFSRWVYSKS